MPSWYLQIRQTIAHLSDSQKEEWEELLTPPPVRPILDYRLERSDYFITCWNYFRKKLPPFELTVSTPSLLPLAIPRIISNCNKGQILLYNDPTSEAEFDVLWVEGQDHEREVWKGYHLHCHNKKYLLLDEAEQIEIPYNTVDAQCHINFLWKGEHYNH